MEAQLQAVLQQLGIQNAGGASPVLPSLPQQTQQTGSMPNAGTGRPLLPSLPQQAPQTGIASGVTSPLLSLSAALGALPNPVSNMQANTLMPLQSATASLDKGLGTGLLNPTLAMLQASMPPQTQSSGMDVGPLATTMLAQLAAQMTSQVESMPKATPSFSKAAPPMQPALQPAHLPGVSGIVPAGIVPHVSQLSGSAGGVSQAGLASSLPQMPSAGSGFVAPAVAPPVAQSPGTSVAVEASTVTQPAALPGRSEVGKTQEADDVKVKSGGPVDANLAGEWRHLESIITILEVDGQAMMLSTDAARDGLRLFRKDGDSRWEAKSFESSPVVSSISLKDENTLAMEQGDETCCMHRAEKSRTILGVWEHEGKRVEVRESNSRLIISAGGEERFLVRRRMAEWEARVISGDKSADSAYLVDHVEGSESITVRQLDSASGVENALVFKRFVEAAERSRSVTRSVTRSCSRADSGPKKAGEPQVPELEDFVQKNALTKRTEMALRDLSSNDQRHVMGLDGGKHAFLLNGKVRDPDAVVMSRIKGLQSEPVRAARSPSPARSNRQRERSKSKSRSRNRSRKRSRSCSRSHSRTRSRSRSTRGRRRNGAADECASKRRGKRRRRRRGETRRRKRRPEEDKKDKSKGKRRRDKRKNKKAASSDYSSDYSSSRSGSDSKGRNSKAAQAGKDEPNSKREPEDWQVDIEKFIGVNGLSQRAQSALRALGREDAMCVMGTDGGKNGFELKGHVRDPDAVVMSRIKKLPQGGSRPAASSAGAKRRARSSSSSSSSPARGRSDAQGAARGEGSAAMPGGAGLMPQAMPQGMPPGMPMMPPGMMPPPPMGMPMPMPGMMPMMPGMTMPMPMSHSNAPPGPPPGGPSSHQSGAGTQVSAPSADPRDNGIDYDDL